MSKHYSNDPSESIQSQGGKARAEKLTAEKRREIAASAAASRWGTPQASHGGVVRIGSWDNIQCFNVEIDGEVRRLISQRSFAQMLGIEGTPKRASSHLGLILDNPMFKTARIRELRKQIENPIRFMTEQKLLGNGYEGSIIVDYCKALMEARREGSLPDYAKPHAEACERIVLSLAGVAIAAMIDAATGYDQIRDRRALEVLLDKYLRKEFSEWAKRFPNDFYQEIFRLRGWEWKGMSVNRPSYVGSITNDVVYERIEIGLLSELRERNPWDKDKGRRDGYHHCLLTEDLGVPKLAQHLYAVVALMKASKDWKSFYKSIQVVFPKKGEVLQLDFDDDLDSDLKDDK